uniref:HNH endonuclease n=1 Tax=Iridovirus LCIVAC01 TaxID=2506607 RepID=A0A481YR26_9VIRU|nr:MAG: HNH endonuclease [Iridovirus LCIVAC01]
MLSNTKNEKWKAISGCPDYLISTKGRIYSNKSNKYLKINIDRFKQNNMRILISLYDEHGKRKTKIVARLIAEAFIPNPENKKTVNHINGDPYDNNIINLEWATHQEQMKHVSDNKLIKNFNSTSIIRPILCFLENKFICEYNSIAEASRDTGICRTSIDKVLVNKIKRAGGYTWKYKEIIHQKIDKEEWKKIVIDGIDTGYQVSNMGRIKNKKGRYIKGTTNRYYIIMDLRFNKIRKSVRIHRLVAKAFILNPNNYPIIDHIDRNRYNNKVSNLRWTTQSGNMNNPNTKKLINIPVHKLSLDWKIIDTFASIRDAELSMMKETGKKYLHISRVCQGFPKYNTAGGYRWKYADT